MRSNVVLPEPLGPRRPTIVPRSTSSDTSSSTRRVDARRCAYANESSVAVSIVDHQIQRPATRTLHTTTAAQTKRPIEQRRVGDHRVILAAFAARIDAEPREFRQELAAEPPPQPALIEPFSPCGDDEGVGAGRNPFLE